MCVWLCQQPNVMDKIAGSRIFGPFEGDAKKKALVEKFLQKKGEDGPLSVQEVEELRLLPFVVRVSVFCAWVRKNKDHEACAGTLDALWEASKLKESDGKSVELADADPLLDVFAPQQTKTADVYDLLQLCLFGSGALCSKERLMRFVESPSNRFRESAISELFKARLLSDADIERMFGELEERGLRALVSCCVRHKRAAVLEPMFPEKILAKLGPRAAINLLHTFPTGSNVVRLHIDALTVDLKQLAEPSPSIEKCQQYLQQHQLSGCGHFWDDMWKFHSAAMMDALSEQLSGAKNFLSYSHIWAAWAPLVSRLISGVQKSLFTIKSTSANWSTGVIFEKLLQWHFVDFPPFTPNLTKEQKEKLQAGNFSLLEAFQSHATSMSHSAPWSNVHHLVPLQSFADFCLGLIETNFKHLTPAIPNNQVVADFVFHRSLLDCLVKQWLKFLAVQKKDRQSVVVIKEKFLQRLANLIYPAIPGKDIFSSQNDSPLLSRVYWALELMLGNVSLSLALQLFPLAKSVLERSVPSSAALGIFPSKLPENLFHDVMPNAVRKGYIVNWVTFAIESVNSHLLGPFSAVFHSLKKTPFCEKKFKQIVQVVDLASSELAAILRVVDELTVKDREIERKKMASLLAGKEAWIARSMGMIKYISKCVSFFSAHLTQPYPYFPLKDKLRIHLNDTLAKVILPLLLNYTKEIQTQGLSSDRAEKHISKILAIVDTVCASNADLPVFHICAQIGEMITQWIDCFPVERAGLFPCLRYSLEFIFGNALRTIEDSKIENQKTELRARFLKLHLWAVQHYEITVIQKEAGLDEKLRVPRVAMLTFAQFLSFVQPLSAEARVIVFSESVVDEILKYLLWDARAALDSNYRRGAPPHRVFGLLPERVLPKVRDTALPLFENFVETSVKTALATSRGNPDVVRQNKSQELLSAYPKNLSHAIVKKMAQKEGGVLTSSDIRHLVLSLSLPVTDEWVYSQIKALSRSSIVSQKHEALSHLFSKAWETEDSDLFIRSFKFIVEVLRNDSPSSRLKLLSQLNEELVRKLKKDFDRASKIFRCDTENGTYPDTQLWLDLVESILTSPETDSKKQLLVRVESFAAVLIKCAMKSFARCCVENHTKGKPMGDYSPAQKSLFNLAAEIKWRTRTFLVGDKKANETFEIALGRIYKEMEGTKETKIHATTRSLELVLGVYTHYVGKFWEDTSRLSSSFYTRVRSLFDICWGHPKRHPVYTQIVESLSVLTKISKVPNPESLVDFMMETAHCGLAKWKKKDSIIRTFVESALFSATEFEFRRDELLGMWLKMTLPYSKGSKSGKSGSARGLSDEAKKRTKKERELYLDTRVDMIRKMLKASPSAIHVKMVWSFLARHRQDLLAPFLKKAQETIFPGPFQDLNKKSLVASLNGDNFNESDEDNDKETDRESACCFLLPASYGLNRLPPPCAQDIANLLELLFLSPNNPVPKRGRYAHSYARLPCVSFSELLPIMQRTQSEGGSLPTAVVDELITVSLTSDEPKSPYPFLFSEEVLRKTDDRVLLRVVNAAMVAVDASNNPSQLARMVKGLLCPPKRRAAISSSIHRIILRLLKNDPTPATYEHLIWELEQQPGNAIVKSAALNLMHEFLSQPELDDKSLEPLFEALKKHANSKLLHILPEEGASLLSVLPEIKGGDEARKNSLLRQLNGNLSAVAIYLAPLISKSEAVSIPPARAARYFRDILFPLYAKGFDKSEKSEKSETERHQWESSLANPVIFAQWKECFVLSFVMWSLLPDIQPMIAEESLKMMFLCAPSPHESVLKSPPVGAHIVTGFQQGKKDLVVRVLCENLIQLPFLESSLAAKNNESHKPILELASSLVDLCKTTPICDHQTLSYILKIFAWSFQLSLSFHDEKQKKQKYAVVLQLGEHFETLLDILSLFQQVVKEDVSSVRAAVTDFTFHIKNAKDNKKKAASRGPGTRHNW